MLFQYQALSALAFTAFTSIARATRLEKYAHAKSDCLPEEVAFCQTYTQEFTRQIYKDCRHFGSSAESTTADLGPMCVYKEPCYFYCNPSGRVGYVVAPNTGNYTCACYPLELEGTWDTAI